MTLALWCLAGALMTLPQPPARIRSKLHMRHGSPGRSRLRPVHCGLAAGAATSFALSPFACIACLMLLITLTFRYHRTRISRTRQQQCRFLLDGLEVLIAELRVGAHPAAAAAIAAAECQAMPGKPWPTPAPAADSLPASMRATLAPATTGDPPPAGWLRTAQPPTGGNAAAAAFATTAATARLGGAGADGMSAAAASSAQVLSAELSRIAGAWRVADTHGLALAELLAAARMDLLGRIRFRGRTEAALAGARASATVLALLPLVGIGLGQLMGAAPLRVLAGPAPGGVLLVLGAAFACAGLLWTDTITGRVLR